MALVSRIIGDCPGCGAKQAFGNVNVYSRYVYRGCGRCRYNEQVPLPELKKKVLYLDQFFFSHAFRANDQKFVDAAKHISSLTANQQLVVPFSSIHEDETHMWERYAELMEFIKHTSRGYEFKPAYCIEGDQLQDAFHAWLHNERVELQKADAIDDDIDVWDGYYRIDVGGYNRDRDLVRKGKTDAIEGLIDLFPHWRNSTNNFEQDKMLEHEAAAKGYINSYVTYFMRLISGDYSALVDSPIMSQIVEGMLSQLPKEMEHKARLQRVVEFFSTEQFREAPVQDLKSRIFATLKMLVVQGAYQNRDSALKKLSGFYYDVDHISTYAPYCDAILIDAPMHEIVGRQQVNLGERYGVKVFSRSNWEQMLTWFDEIEAEMTDEHRQALAVAYT
ncbi:hypothetical protein ACK9YZ_14130 [Rhizobium sp. ZK1]|uniref:hypothetical protein n=1 Tax=Rhizobium sp. ZK1 TaxID=3389872 RepID=UPI0039F659DF